MFVNWLSSTSAVQLMIMTIRNSPLAIPARTLSVYSSERSVQVNDSGTYDYLAAYVCRPLM